MLMLSVNFIIKPTYRPNLREGLACETSDQVEVALLTHLHWSVKPTANLLAVAFCALPSHDGAGTPCQVCH